MSEYKYKKGDVVTCRFDNQKPFIGVVSGLVHRGIEGASPMYDLSVEDEFSNAVAFEVQLTSFHNLNVFELIRDSDG